MLFSGHCDGFLNNAVILSLVSSHWTPLIDGSLRLSLHHWSGLILLRLILVRGLSSDGLTLKLLRLHRFVCLENSLLWLLRCWSWFRSESLLLRLSWSQSSVDWWRRNKSLSLVHNWSLTSSYGSLSSSHWPLSSSYWFDSEVSSIITKRLLLSLRWTLWSELSVDWCWLSPHPQEFSLRL